MVLEVPDEKAVVWTRPDDLVIDLSQPLAWLPPARHRGFDALFCDGSVRFIPDTIDAKSFTALLTVSGQDTSGAY
jgi:hypothetical protein